MEKLIIEFNDKRYEVKNNKKFFKLEKLFQDFLVSSKDKVFFEEVIVKGKIFYIEDLLLEAEVSSDRDDTNILKKDLLSFIKEKKEKLVQEEQKLIKEFKEDFDEDDWDEFEEEYILPIKRKLEKLEESKKLLTKPPKNTPSKRSSWFFKKQI